MQIYYNTKVKQYIKVTQKLINNILVDVTVKNKVDLEEGLRGWGRGGGR